MKTNKKIVVDKSVCQFISNYELEQGQKGRRCLLLFVNKIFIEGEQSDIYGQQKIIYFSIYNSNLIGFVCFLSCYVSQSNFIECDTNNQIETEMN